MKSILTIGSIAIVLVVSILAANSISAANVRLLTKSEMQNLIGAEACYPCKTALGDAKGTGGCQECVKQDTNTWKQFSSGGGSRGCESANPDSGSTCSLTGSINCGSGRWHYYGNDECDGEDSGQSEVTTHSVGTANGTLCPGAS